jgi:hypothetical protein
MKSCSLIDLPPPAREIATRHFGRRIAQARTNQQGSIYCYLVSIDPDLFFKRLGPNIIASVMNGHQWFDLARIAGTFRVRIPGMPSMLKGCETLSGHQTKLAPDCFKVWSDQSLLVKRSLPRRRPLNPKTNLDDLCFLANVFSAAIRPSTAEGLRPKGNLPLIIVPETSPQNSFGFSRSAVVLQ